MCLNSSFIWSTKKFSQSEKGHKNENGARESAPVRVKRSGVQRDSTIYFLTQCLSLYSFPVYLSVFWALFLRGYLSMYSLFCPSFFPFPLFPLHSHSLCFKISSVSLYVFFSSSTEFCIFTHHSLRGRGQGKMR